MCCKNLLSIGKNLVYQHLSFELLNAILFQISVLTHTMCRHSIFSLWIISIGKLIPYNDITKYHIALGYTIIMLLFTTIVVFMTSFGTLCNSGTQDFCRRFKYEIIIVGYIIFIVLMTVGATSIFRFKIPHRMCYIAHHLIFIASILTIMHTIDVVERWKRWKKSKLQMVFRFLANIHLT